MVFRRILATAMIWQALATGWHGILIIRETLRDEPDEIATITWLGHAFSGRGAQTLAGALITAALILLFFAIRLWRNPVRKT